MTSPPLTKREYAYIRVTGHGSHNEFSEAIGIEATNQWSEGDTNPRNKLPYKFMAWQRESGLDDTHDIDEHIAKLLTILEPIKSRILELGSKYNISIQCVAYFPASGHGLHLDEVTIRKLAELNLCIDYDFYYVDDFGHNLDYK